MWGKSALFNRICGKKKIAIVDEAGVGVTKIVFMRMRPYSAFNFKAIDTGGINAHSKALFNEEIKRQAGDKGIEEADVLDHGR